MQGKPRNNAAQVIDWARYYEICVGMIGIQPKAFWEMSPIEVFLATAGFKEFHGGNRPEPMSRGELNELMELHPD